MKTQRDVTRGDMYEDNQVPPNEQDGYERAITEEKSVTKTNILELEDMSVADYKEPRRKITRMKKEISLAHS